MAKPTDHEDPALSLRPFNSPQVAHLKRILPFLGYLLAQSYIVAGLATPRFPDSAGYMSLSFTGQDLRLWTVPLLYRLFPNDTLRIAAQVVLATCAWWFLASAASRMVGNSRVRLGLRIVLLMLGLVGPISSWNSTILSDSVSISLTALLIGCWLQWVNRRTRITAAWVILVTLFWTFTRNDLVILGLGVTIVFAVWTLVRRRTAMNLVLLAGLIAISTYGVTIYDRNPFVATTNIADVIADRVLPNTDWTTWFIDHGMPYSTAIQGTQGSLYYQALFAIPAFKAWLDADGTQVYLQFILEHPTYTLLGPLPDFSGERASLLWPNRSPYVYTQLNPTPSMLSPDANYGRHRDILPDVVENLLFEQGQIGDVMLLAFCAAGLAWVARRRFGRDQRMMVPIIAAISTIPEGYLVWLTGGDGETDRHAIVLAVTLRIGLWIMAGFALDRILEAKDKSPSGYLGTTAQAGNSKID